MANVCACCQHSERAELDAALLSNSHTLKDLAVAYGLSVYSLSRHKARHLLASPGKAAPLTIEEEVRAWLSRSEELWHLAGANGDLRGLATALQQGLRSLEFSIRHREEEAQAQVRDLPDSPADWTHDEGIKMIQFMDHILADTVMPTPENYESWYRANGFAAQKGENHEHFKPLPLRN